MSRPNLLLDIETLSTEDPDVIARLIVKIEVASICKSASEIEAYKAENAESIVERTALDGSVGRVYIIGSGWNLDGTVTASSAMFENQILGADVDTISRERDCFDERKLLTNWFAAQDRVVKNDYLGISPRIVGHHVAGFDILFLTQRAIILGVRLPSWWPKDPKPWGNDVLDTMVTFAGTKGTIGLDRLCRALGLPGRGEVDGSKVGHLFAGGMHDVAMKYCCDDVERVRSVFRKFQVAFGESL